MIRAITAAIAARRSQPFRHPEVMIHRGRFRWLYGADTVAHGVSWSDPRRHRHRPGGPRHRHQLADLPAKPGVGTAGDGVPLHRHDCPAPVVCAGRDGARQRRVHIPRRHRPSDRGVARPAGLQPGHGPRRPVGVVSVPDPRPGREVRRIVRRGGRRRERRGRQDSTPGARDLRARHRSSATPRSGSSRAAAN
jgi:hypothetical protein